VNPPVIGYKFTNQRLKDMGMDFVPVLQCLYETVKSLQEKGMLPVLPPKDDQDQSTNHDYSNADTATTYIILYI